ncbi:hypothetical protein AAMO2058_000562400 [Amorphochlora amoebiformis]
MSGEQRIDMPAGASVPLGDLKVEEKESRQIEMLERQVVALQNENIKIKVIVSREIVELKDTLARLEAQQTHQGEGGKQRGPEEE